MSQAGMQIGENKAARRSCVCASAQRKPPGSIFSEKFLIQTRAGGKTDRMEMTQDGKWLGASCGNLKPRR